MKIALGPLKVSFKEDGRKPETGEVGAPGTIFVFGQLTEEEYNSDLRGDKARIIYDKMRRSDAQVKATLLVCELPFRAASWAVEPASKDSQDIEIAEFIQDNLFEGMSITWDSFLHHVMLMLPFGFSIFEKVYKVVDGQVKWRKFAPRLPKTLYKWNLDPKDAGLVGIQQFVWKNDKYDFIHIPVEKLLIFTNEKEGSNFEGISLLRAAYKHWYYKDHLYRLDGISAERHATGIPYFKHPPDATDSEKRRLDSMGQHLYAHELQYVRTSSDYEFDIKGLSGVIRDLNPSIEHHDRMIARSILAQFLNLGTGDTGSWALARDQSSFFLMSLRSLGKNICDTINRYAIPQLVNYNWGVAKYPTLRVSGLETKNMADYAKAVVDLVTVGALNVDSGLQATLRDMLDLPKAPQEEKEKEIFIGAEKKWRREFTYAERFVSFSEISDALDKAEKKFIEVTKEIQDRQINKISEIAVKAIQTKKFDRFEDIDIPYRQDMTNAMLAIRKELFKYGRQQVKDELKKQSSITEIQDTRKAEMAEPIDPEDEAEIMAFLAARTKVTSSLLANKLKQKMMVESMRQIKQGIVDKKQLAKKLRDLSDKELKLEARYGINDAFNYGRSYEATKHDIDRVQYSALLDSNVCEQCTPLDGQEWDFDDERTDKYASGNPECLGCEKCRCVLVFISREERR